MSIAVTDEEAKLPHPKLERLRLGYCARDGCESDYYTISFEECPGVDWGIVAEQARQLVTATETATKEQARRTAIRRRYQAIMRVVLGLIIVGSLLLCRFVLSHGRLPFVKKPAKYQIDPASTRHRTLP